MTWMTLMGRECTQMSCKLTKRGNNFWRCQGYETSSSTRSVFEICKKKNSLASLVFMCFIGMLIRLIVTTLHNGYLYCIKVYYSHVHASVPIHVNKMRVCSMIKTAYFTIK